MDGKERAICFTVFGQVVYLVGSEDACRFKLPGRGSVEVQGPLVEIRQLGGKGFGKD